MQKSRPGGTRPSPAKPVPRELPGRPAGFGDRFMRGDALETQRAGALQGEEAAIAGYARKLELGCHETLPIAGQVAGTVRTLSEAGERAVRLVTLIVETPAGVLLLRIPNPSPLPPGRKGGTAAEEAVHDEAAIWGLPDFTSGYWVQLRHYDHLLVRGDATELTTVGVLLSPRHDGHRPFDTTMIAVRGDLEFSDDELRALRDAWPNPD